ncbi:hypothetical protein GUITHDRAFT_148776 [Guillardia theta CCMP2712]|uniref:SET domain-containing protein n=1 Tax=Guillardia theta (strain CCMP2712) TaxID=905079 RepID=L1I7I2_GUITC|nr:hypothetical protein GUITHDRAFT_148776 [Guillardia theta CCMP2712]EKX32226.1 hypothetical protein GUITHDRAFT_148776 [Guillardia theta CCMP2712]|eukprot:XP_005819206.1 hypothetical protein GUITHDRAFT_148776 [Guillardia theta CCMP2712]
MEGSHVKEEQLELVDVIHVEGMGNGVFARKHFSEGDVVMSERPSVVLELSYAKDELAKKVNNFLRRSACEEAKLSCAFQWTLWLCHFFQLPEALRNRIETEVYSPREDDGVAGVIQSETFSDADKFSHFLSDFCSSSFTALMDLPELEAVLDVDAARLKRLMLLYICNFHQYQGKAALFLKCCKLNHSCRDANTKYVVDCSGLALHVALRDISPGEQILTDYLQGIPFMSTHERRKKLLETKLFTCMCSACLSEDDLRLLPCTSRGDEGEACQGSCSCRDGRWMCKECGREEEVETFLSQQFLRLCGLGLAEASNKSRAEMAEEFLKVEERMVKESYSKIFWSVEEMGKKHAHFSSALGRQHPAARRMEWNVERTMAETSVTVGG